MLTDSTTAEGRLALLCIDLPTAPAPFGAYVPAVQCGSVLYLSGMLATSGHTAVVAGVVGGTLDAAAARQAARTAALNALALLRRELGSLNRIRRLVRIGVYIAATPEFANHVEVADGASELLRDVLGEASLPARLVIGVASLPLGSPVELEVIAEVTA